MNLYILKEILYFCDVDTIELIGILIPNSLGIIKQVKKEQIKTKLEWKYKPKEHSFFGNYIYGIKKFAFKFSEFSYLAGYKWERLNYSYIFIRDESKAKKYKLINLFSYNKNKNLVTSHYEINAHHYYDEYVGYEYNNNKIKTIEGIHDWITIRNDSLLENALRFQHNEKSDKYMHQILTSYEKSANYWNYYRKNRLNI